MTATELLLLALVVIAAVAAGYFIGRWSADREIGARSARPNPLPAPGDDVAYDAPTDSPSETAPRRPRGAPPPASAGGDNGAPGPAPSSRQRSAPPPASAGGEPSASRPSSDAAPSRPKRGPPPPAAAGVMGGDKPTRNS